PDGIETRETFEWVTYDYETVVVSPDHAYTQTLTSYILARGTYQQTNVQGSGLDGGPFTTMTSCQVYSDHTPVVIKGGGSYIQPVPAKQNPLLELGWMLPDYGNVKVRSDDRPQFHVTGTANCPQGTSTFLSETPDINGTVFAKPSGSASARKEFFDAFSGTAAIHYAAIASHPWTRRFDVTLKDTATSPGFHGPAVDTAKVVVKSLVKFERVTPTAIDYSPPQRRDKIADLLIGEGFGDLSTQGPASGPPVGAAGDPDTVVIPGFGPGQVSIDVNGTVLPSGRAQAHDAVAAEPLLASARTRVSRGGAPVSLRIVPTAAGRRLLKRPHRAFRARYTLSFRPAGSRRTYRGVRLFTVPAMP
ncbi:MAG: hypothetical protein ACRDNK_13565, partial [Solirubrobacteraceae bacterium]